MAIRQTLDPTSPSSGTRQTATLAPKPVDQNTSLPTAQKTSQTSVLPTGPIPAGAPIQTSSTEPVVQTTATGQSFTSAPQAVGGTDKFGSPQQMTDNQAAKQQAVQALGQTNPAAAAFGPTVFDDLTSGGGGGGGGGGAGDDEVKEDTAGQADQFGLTGTFSGMMNNYANQIDSLNAANNRLALLTAGRMGVSGAGGTMGGLFRDAQIATEQGTRGMMKELFGLQHQDQQGDKRFAEEQTLQTDRFGQERRLQADRLAAEAAMQEGPPPSEMPLGGSGEQGQVLPTDVQKALPGLSESEYSAFSTWANDFATRNGRTPSPAEYQAQYKKVTTLASATGLSTTETQAKYPEYYKTWQDFATQMDKMPGMSEADAKAEARISALQKVFGLSAEEAVATYNQMYGDTAGKIQASEEQLERWRLNERAGFTGSDKYGGHK